MKEAVVESWKLVIRTLIDVEELLPLMVSEASAKEIRAELLRMQQLPPVLVASYLHKHWLIWDAFGRPPPPKDEQVPLSLLLCWFLECFIGAAQDYRKLH